MRVGIGPRNTAGQGYLLARALRGSGIDAESFAYQQHPLPLHFPVDRPVTREEMGDPAFRAYTDTFTHLVFWNAISPRGAWFDRDLAQYQGQQVALMFRGSELRIPERHKRREPWSPFGLDKLSETLQLRSGIMHERLRRSRPLPMFVATREMIHYAPAATWCPIIADPVPNRAPVLARERPTVLHSPTKPLLKGSAYLHEDPSYELIRHPALVSPDQMLRDIREADVVVDGLVLGDYGGTAIQAMAAGRVVVGNVNERVRQALPDLPIVQADPSTVTDVLRDIASHPDTYRLVAEQGPAFHARYHDGRYSVAQLAGFLEMAVAA